MPRPEKPIETVGPVATFAEDLRALRRAAGLGYRSMAIVAHYSPTTLSQAAAGKKLPPWPVVEAFVKACNGDPARWLTRWQNAQTEAAADITAQPTFREPALSTAAAALPASPPPATETNPVRPSITLADETPPPRRPVRTPGSFHRPLPGTHEPYSRTPAVQVGIPVPYSGTRISLPPPPLKQQPVTSNPATASPSAPTNDALGDDMDPVGVVPERWRLLSPRSRQVPATPDKPKKPDPDTALVMSDLAILLNQYRRYAGLTWRGIADQSRTSKRWEGRWLAASTLHETLVKRGDPTLELTEQILDICGATPEEIYHWRKAWQRINAQELRARAALDALNGHPSKRPTIVVTTEPPPLKRRHERAGMLIALGALSITIAFLASGWSGHGFDFAAKLPHLFGIISSGVAGTGAAFALENCRSYLLRKRAHGDHRERPTEKPATPQRPTAGTRRKRPVLPSP